ncbi:MAG TPA: helix-turn-helix domain-containing protein [Aquihabitans sp.]|jgi:excisionase family DNA binding protein|nr:helix-turn-helix domain-containing protein [Aquihabitans sp.]
MTDARFLTVAQLAAELGISRSAAYNLTGRGALPVVKIGDSIRVERTAVEAFIAAGGERVAG